MSYLFSFRLACRPVTL